MFKRLHILFLFCAIIGTLSLRAQERFFNFLDGWRANYSIESDQGYTVFGLEGIGNPDQHQVLYTQIDLQGNLVEELEYVIPDVHTTSTHNRASMTIEMTEGIYLSAGYYIDLTSASDSQHVAVYTFDEAAGTIDTLMTFSDANWSIGFSMEKIDDSNFLLFASLADSGTFNITSRLYSVNLDGTVNWTYDSSCGYACRHWPEEVLKLSDGKVLVMIREFYYGGAGFTERMKTVLTLLDENGNHLWTRFPGDEENYHINPGGICEVDGTILVTYSDPYYYDGDGEWVWNDTMTVFLEVLDSNGSMISQQEYLYELPNNLEETSVLYDITQTQVLDDGSILISGTTYRGGLLILLDQEGSVQWFREYQPHPNGENDDAFEQTTFIYHVLETSDGGFLCTGTYDSSPSNLYPGGIQSAFALKLDEYGCLVENCTVGISEFQVQDSRLELFPNPVSSSLNVRVPQGTVVDHVMLVDAMGRIIEDSNFKIQGSYSEKLESVSLNLESLPAGLYTIILSSEDGELFSSKFVKE